MKKYSVISLLFILFILTTGKYLSAFSLDYSRINQGVQLESENTRIRFRNYASDIIRVQFAQKGKKFFKDGHYEMVANHDQKGKFSIKKDEQNLILQNKKMKIKIDRQKLNFDIINKKSGKNLLSNGKMKWKDHSLKMLFDYDQNEHFSGLGHKSYGQVESLDLKGKKTNCNYGSGYGTEDGYGIQAPLVVPFYISSKGYGLFLNSTFPNTFNFGKNQEYSFSIDTKGFEGRMDFFIIFGPDPKKVLKNYISLTGKPRLPQKSIFGLHLSDKGAPDNKGAAWWRKRVKKHREAGYPLDHVIVDNRWRAGSGDWDGSRFEWSPERYPNPEKFNNWLNKHGLTMSVDLNRNICNDSWGWKKEYNMENTDSMRNHTNSVPDYTNPEVRNWVWELFWKKTLDPKLNYPGDGLWIDEVDDLYDIPLESRGSNGRSWAENQNYYLYLAAKAIGQEGWDNKNQNNPPGLKDKKRPYIWSRGSAAGAQRYATHWTGDLKCKYSWMRNTIRGMQSSGLSGFPYFNHDAGGFRNPGPDDNMYIQWSLAFGSFSPIWRPHGPGKNKRWPLQRDQQSQKYAQKYSQIRYKLMPYIYTTAHQAHNSGLPMARPMMLYHHTENKAWNYDLQYYWGDNMLVRPVPAQKDTTVKIWFPKEHDWYNYWNNKLIQGGQTKSKFCKEGKLPVFVKSGAIIPERKYAKSTFWLKKDFLELDVYTGESGEFTIIEDDDVTEKYQNPANTMRTKVVYSEKKSRLIINKPKGKYKGAPTERSYKVKFNGVKGNQKIKINGNEIENVDTIDKNKNICQAVYLENKDIIKILTKNFDIKEKVVIELY